LIQKQVSTYVSQELFVETQLLETATFYTAFNVMIKSLLVMNAMLVINLKMMEGVRFSTQIKMKYL